MITRKPVRVSAICVAIAASGALPVFAEQQDPETIVITGKSVSPYSSHETPKVSRSGLAIKDLARSVQVYNEQLIRDIQPAKIDDIITLSPNVIYLGDNDGRENTFVMRGFKNSDLIQDGFKLRQSISDPEVFNLEQVEVMTGADSVLYGASSAGGLISATSKRPLDVEHSEITFETNNVGAINPKIDLGGPANQQGSVRYRVVASYDKDPGWRDFNVDNKRKFIATSLAIDLNEAATLTVFAERTDDDVQNDMGTAIDNNGRPVTRLETVNSHPDDIFSKNQTVFGADLDYAFNDNWSGSVKYRHVHGGFDYGSIWLPFNYSAPNYLQVPATQASKYTEHALQVNLSGDLHLAGMRHRISTGIDISNATSIFRGCFDARSAYFLDFSNPVYAPLPGDVCDTNIFPNTINYAPGGEDRINRRGVFVTDAVSVTEKLTITGGLRYEDHSQEAPSGGSYSASAEEDILIPQLAVSYKLNEQLSTYASYSESFNPATQRDRNGQLLDAESGKGFEIGAKSSLMDDQLQLNFAVFDVTKDNVATPDPDPVFAAQGVSVASGEQNSRGLEIDMIGSLTPKLDLVASVGLLDTEDKAQFSGKQLINAAKRTASIWTSYKVTPHWKVGLGLQHVGHRFANQDNTVKLQGYTLVNAAVTYQQQNWRAQLNLNNITDEEYIESAWGGTARSVTPGEPANATFSISYSF